MVYRPSSTPPPHEGDPELAKESEVDLLPWVLRVRVAGMKMFDASGEDGF